MSVDFERMAAHLPADQRKQLGRQYRRSAKNETTAFLSCFFLGIFGVHHMYLGEWARGLAHLIIPVVAAIAVVAGVLGGLPSLPIIVLVVVLLVAGLIWEIIELFQVDDKVRQHNLTLAESLIGAGALADSSALTDAVARLDSAMTGATVAAGAAGAAVVGAITAEDISAARAMAGEHNAAIMEEFDSSTTKFISDDPSATTPGAPTAWSETTVSGTPDPSADDTLDLPAPEYVTHTHTETANTVTDSYEYDRAPDATQPMAIPTTREAEAATWPDHPPLNLAANAMDVTDHHAYVPPTEAIADVEGAGATPHYVTLPDDQSATAEAAAAAAIAPLAVDASTTARDATDAHPHAPHAELVADVEANPAQAVYVNLPDETYVPPIVPVTDAAAAVAGAGAGAGFLASQAAETAPEAPVDASPTSGPLMKRIRMKRQIVVDGQVVREEVVEKLVPIDTDTTSMVAEMDTQLGHATKEEIAYMANLDPDSNLDLRRRTELPADEQ
ncbi:MAG TPA: TM2 domain-containing protein [Ktedonobacterales bacterium]|jgi:TM2 domain-containing membrane protein YozV